MEDAQTVSGLAKSAYSHPFPSKHRLSYQRKRSMDVVHEALLKLRFRCMAPMDSPGIQAHQRKRIQCKPRAAVTQCIRTRRTHHLRCTSKHHMNLHRTSSSPVDADEPKNLTLRRYRPRIQGPLHTWQLCVIRTPRVIRIQILLASQTRHLILRHPLQPRTSLTNRNHTMRHNQCVEPLHQQSIRTSKRPRLGRRTHLLATAIRNKDPVRCKAVSKLPRHHNLLHVPKPEPLLHRVRQVPTKEGRGAA